MRLNFRNMGTNGAESITDYTRKYSVYEISNEKNDGQPKKTFHCTIKCPVKNYRLTNSNISAII